MSSSADRQRAYRRRYNAGEAVLPVPVQLVALEDALERSGLLEPCCEHDREQLIEAVSKLLERLCEAA